MQFGSVCFEAAEPLGRIGLNGHELMSSHVELVLEIVIIDSKTAHTPKSTQPTQTASFNCFLFSLDLSRGFGQFVFESNLSSD